MAAVNLLLYQSCEIRIADENIAITIKARVRGKRRSPDDSTSKISTRGFTQESLKRCSGEVKIPRKGITAPIVITSAKTETSIRRKSTIN
jgi:hypothetical protein